MFCILSFVDFLCRRFCQSFFHFTYRRQFHIGAMSCKLWPIIQKILVYQNRKMRRLIAQKSNEQRLGQTTNIYSLEKHAHFNFKTEAETQLGQSRNPFFLTKTRMRDEPQQRLHKRSRITQLLYNSFCTFYSHTFCYWTNWGVWLIPYFVLISRRLS